MFPIEAVCFYRERGFPKRQKYTFLLYQTSENTYWSDRPLFHRLLFYFLYLFHVSEPPKMKQMGESRFFFQFSEIKISRNICRWRDLRYKFTFIVFVLTPLILEECLKCQISSIYFIFTVGKNLKKILHVFQLFQPTANCFISSVCFTVLRPGKWNN